MFRPKVPVQRLGSVVRFRKVPAQRLGEVSEGCGPGADTYFLDVLPAAPGTKKRSFKLFTPRAYSSMQQVRQLL